MCLYILVNLLYCKIARLTVYTPCSQQMCQNFVNIEILKEEFSEFPILYLSHQQW